MKLGWFILMLGLQTATTHAASEAALRDSIQRAVPFLERSSVAALRERACFTCHNGAAPLIALNEAHKFDFKIDPTVMEAQVERITRRFAASMRSGTSRGTVAGQADGPGWKLTSLKALAWPSDDATDAAVDYLIHYKPGEDHWFFTIRRPPTVGSHFTSTWVVLEGLLHYAAPDQQLDVLRRAGEAYQWILQTPSHDTEDAVSRLRCLTLLAPDSDEVNAESAKLLGQQRSSGGWAQLRDWEPDAYATGTVLAALIDTEQVKPGDAAFQRGVTFLLETQKRDGTWQVTKRARFIQEMFDSEFPHEDDQFISTVGTCWAVYALTKALPAPASQKDYYERHPELHAEIAGIKVEQPITRQQADYFSEQVLPVLENKCFKCHSKQARNVKADLYLDSHQGMMTGGINGPVVVSGTPAHSLLIKALRGLDGMDIMPPKGGPLPQDEIAAIEKWVLMGAPDPR